MEAHLAHTPLTSVRARAAYSPAERQFALLLKQRLDELLQGKRQRFDFLRKYPGESGRIGVIPTPAGLCVSDVRPQTLERLTWAALASLHVDGGGGGAIAQLPDSDGGVFEVQTFPTRFAQFVIERVDHFPGAGGDADCITWSLVRAHNERPPQLKSFLDATALLVDVLRLLG